MKNVYSFNAAKLKTLSAWERVWVYFLDNFFEPIYAPPAISSQIPPSTGTGQGGKGALPQGGLGGPIPIPAGSASGIKHINSKKQSMKKNRITVKFMACKYSVYLKYSFLVICWLLTATVTKAMPL